MYDYNLGRFYSVDPVIQAPGNSQSMNPYSYIMNNPLAGTDPTGYTSEGIAGCSPFFGCDNPKDPLDRSGPFNYPKGCKVCVSTGGGQSEDNGKEQQAQKAVKKFETKEIISQQNKAQGLGGSSINQNGVGLFEGVGQRFGNLVTRGQFMTYEQTDVYDAAAKIAYLSGGNEGLMDFFRENPLFSGTKGVAEMLAGVGAIRLVSVSTRGATVAISGEAAEAYMISQGVPAHLAPEFVASFQGQIKARIVQKGESFIRYSSQAGGQGSFVTQKVYSSPGAAVDALYLKPF
uniref:RHS repeat domain-containing protein n=1 Tax=Arsukibacterium sp. TaxID=1977258 RepID=UPI002FDB364B